MGTNYYVRTRTCENPKHHDLVHVGKSSAGWRFLFSAHDGLRTQEEWFRFLDDHFDAIESEYGNGVTVEYLRSLVAGKHNGRSHTSLGDLGRYWQDGAADFFEGEFS